MCEKECNENADYSAKSKEEADPPLAGTTLMLGEVLLKFPQALDRD